MRHTKKILHSHFLSIIIGFGTAFSASTSQADQDTISLFPLDNYNQSISAWIKPNDPDFDKPLLNAEMQKKRFDIFLDHYIGSSSPWNADYINKLLHQAPPNDFKTVEQSIITNFNNDGKSADQIGYGENFHPYTAEWINDISNNIHISQLDGLTYQSHNRAIVVDNLHARVLPTDDVHFYSYKLAGQGYPFDNLQMSALWAGTPVYILGESRDQAWMLVVTPDFIAWVKSSSIARTDSSFINTWTTAAKNKLAAITHTKTSLIDNNGKFILSAYVGTVFPATATSAGMELRVPVMDTEHNATIKTALVNSDNAVTMPLTASPHTFSAIMNTMIGRPYGWGSMYFYNDCSAELKSLLTPFGIWLPRHSSDQVTVGKMVDKSADSTENRLSYLMANGHRFLTLIYIGGHVVMYVGNYPNPNNNQTWMAMTYQNAWGISPNPPTRRSVIGKSVLLPMLLQYPEDTSLVSQAGKKYFQVSDLNELPSANVLLQQQSINLRSLMYPASLSD